MIKKTLTAAAIAGSAFLLVLGGASSAMAAPGDDIVVNGDFDAAGFDANDGIFVNGQGVTGWQVTSGLKGLSGGGFASDGQGIGMQIFYPGMGEPLESVGGPYNNGPWAALFGRVTQTLPTEPGKTYRVTYNPRVAGWTPTNEQWQTGGNQGTVLINGEAASSFQTVLGQTNASQSFVFTATGPETVLAFSIGNTGAVGVDSVSVVEVAVEPSPLMIPAIAGGIGMAVLAAGSGFVLRRKSKRVE